MHAPEVTISATRRFICTARAADRTVAEALADASAHSARTSQRQCRSVGSAIGLCALRSLCALIQRSQLRNTSYIPHGSQRALASDTMLLPQAVKTRLPHGLRSLRPAQRLEDTVGSRLRKEPYYSRHAVDYPSLPQRRVGDPQSVHCNSN